MRSSTGRVRFVSVWPLFFAVFIVLALFTAQAFAGTGSESDRELTRVVARLEARYDKLKSVSADFTQEVLSVGMSTPMLSGGRVWFKKPGMMRWIYSTGSTDELIGNKESVWLYQPDLNQVIEAKASHVSSIATDFLTGVGRLDNDFFITLLSKNRVSYRLLLIPRDETTGISKLILEAGSKDNIVFRTVAEDVFGTSTTVTFTNIRFDVIKKNSFFNFVPPSGVNVIRR